MGQIKDYLESKKKETVTRSLEELHAAARKSVGNRAAGSVSTLSGADRDRFDNDVRQNYAARQTASTAQKTTATATQGAGRYYSQPATDPAVNRLGNSLEVYKKNVELKEAALNSANTNAQRLYNSLKELEDQGARLGQYSTSKLAMAKLNEVKAKYQQTYQQYEQAAQQAQAAYGEYTPAWEQYATAAKDFETSYAAQQKAYTDWKSTVRTDESAIAAELEGAKKAVEALKEQQKSASQQEEETTRREQEKKLTTEISRAEAEVERLQEELDWRKYFNYADLEKNADFAEKSRYKSTANGQEERNLLGGYRNTGFDDIDYDYINKNETAISRKGLNDVQSNASFLGVDKSERGEMTEEEIAIFNYLYAQDTAKGDAEHKSAYGYIDYLTKSLNQRKRTAEQEEWAGYAKEHPVRASAFSVLENPLKGLSYLGQAADYLEDGTIDQNAGYNRFSQMNSAIRGQVSQMAEDKWGAPGSFLYQTGMSMADFLYNSLLTGAIGGEAMLGKTGAKAAGNIALAIMGTGAAADATIEAKDRGLTDTQAFTLGTIAGLAEVITEKVSVEALFNGDWEQGALRYIIKNVVSEGSEEVASDLINLFADVLISKDKSQWQAALEEYKAGGKTEEEAFWLAVKDQGLEMGVDFLGGALSGGVMAGAGAAIGAVGTAISQRGEQRKTAPDVGAVKNENGLTALTELEKENLSSGKRNKIVSTFQEALAFVKGAITNKADTSRAYMGKLTERTVQKIQQQTGENLDGYGTVLNSENVRHILKRHGNTATEQALGQRGVTPEDIALIPKVLADPDKVVLSTTTDGRGRRTLLFEKEIGDSYVTVQAISDGTKTLQTDTLYIKIKEGSTDTGYNASETADPAHNARSVPPSEPSLVDSVPQSGVEVKPVARQSRVAEMTAERKNTVAEGGGKDYTEAERRTNKSAAEAREELRQAAERSLGESGQKAILGAYEAGQDTAEYYAGFSAYYQAAKEGKAQETVKGDYAKGLNPAQRMAAYTV